MGEGDCTVKKVVFRTINEKVGERKQEIVFSSVMLDSLNAGGMQGITIPEMRKRIKVIDQIEAAVKAEGDCVLLEEELHATLLQCLKSYKFSRVFRGTIELMDAVEFAPDVEVAEAA
jgi:hypothetical protein